MKPFLVAAGLLAVGGGAAVALKPRQRTEGPAVSRVHPLLPAGSAAPSVAAAVSRVVVTTRNYDLGRTGWNRNEPRLKPSNVTASTFHKVGVLRVDDKIESSPLYVAGVHTSAGTRDVLLVTTTNNSVYAFDANNQAVLWQSVDSLRPVIPSLKSAIYEKWGITSTPVIDTDTDTVYVIRLAKENGNLIYRLFGLRLADGSEAFQSQAVNDLSVTRDGNTFVNGQQYIRTALALWRNPAGDKAIVFGASGGEDVHGPHGWVIAYNVAKLHAGGKVTPAVWCSSPGSGGVGIWMAAQGVAVDESDPQRDIYLATGNGPYRQQFGADLLGESVVRLHYNPSANTLNVADWFTPFTDESHDPNHQDQDLGAAGVLLIPNSRTVLAGGKEGIFYNVDRTNMGKRSHGNLLQPDFIGTFTQTPGTDYLSDTNQATTTDGAAHATGSDRTFIPNAADGGHTRHVHGGAVYFETGAQKQVFVMGENSTLRAFGYDGTKLTTPAAESTGITAASFATPPPGGMPGGFLAVSSVDASGTDGIVWSISPRKSFWRDPAANAVKGSSVLRAFRPTPTNGAISELWNSEIDAGDAVGTASKFQPPLVANGRVYVVTYDNSVVVYGNTPARQAPRDTQRTMVLIKAHTQPGQDLFLRGGVDVAFGNAHGRDCPTAAAPPKDDPKFYNCAVRIEHRNTINYGERHEAYPITNAWQVKDTYLDWYEREEFQIYRRKDASGNPLGFAKGTPLDWTTNKTSNAFTVARHGFGFLKENQDAGLGDDYWMLDVDMDCGTATHIGGVSWFEVKSFMTNSNQGFEPDVNQADRPFVSGNHFGKCGKINIFERGNGSVTYRDFDATNQCSVPNSERRCEGGNAQVCKTVGGVRVWQTAQDCVAAKKLCQITTGACCTPSNGFNGSNRNCL